MSHYKHSKSHVNKTRRSIIDLADSSDNYHSSQWSHSPRSDLELESNQDVGGDYDELSKLPNSSEVFTFNSEKNWDNEAELLDKSEASAYFTLNLKLLNAGLQTIPFYKRMEYSVSDFDKQEMNQMNLLAEMAEAKYKEIVKTVKKSIKRKVKSAQKIDDEKSSARDYDIEKSKITELDELLDKANLHVDGVSIKEPDSARAPIKEPNLDEIGDKKDIKEIEITKPVEVSTKEDIQQWLDDILE